MAETLSTTGGNVGQAWQQTGGNDYNAIDFMVRQIIAGKTFNAIVQVKAVTGGGTAAAPMLTVQPLVNQIDGLGNSIPHGTIYNIPAFRLQAGSSGIICDPAVGDIGLAVICDRDISNVKTTKAVSNPGSFRKNSWADGCYIGGFLNGTLAQFIRFVASNGGIDIVTPGPLTFSASNATLDSSGNLKANGDVIAMSGAAQISLTNHLTSAVTTGDEQSGPPVPGT